jgi:uncharacterized protein (DUF305 family)
MMRSKYRARTALPLLIAGAVACSGGGSAAARPQGAPTPAPAPPGATSNVLNPADVHFMSGMIPHHAQAVLIAGWAPSHGASPEVQRLCARIVVGQTDEIGLMQAWLRQRALEVPPANATHMRMTMDGMTHDILMPGMLNDEELKQLDASRGADFDRLFLQAMIRHHQGAIIMVDELEAAPGSRQDETVFRFSSDVYADQTTEIDRMQKMLAAIK